MPSKDNVTISTKMNKDFVEHMKMKAASEGKSLGRLVREALEGERREYEGERIEGKIAEICFLYDMTPSGVLNAVESLLEQGKLFLKDGKLCWNPNKRNPDYISIDDDIDRMGLSPKEVNRLKQEIRDNLRRMVNNDYTGNGGGL